MTTKREYPHPLTPVTDLSADCLFTTPVDWPPQELSPEVGEWEAWAGHTCEDCGEAVAIPIGETSHREATGADCDGYLFNEGPMMSYAYPLPAVPEDVQELARLLVNLPLCVLVVDGEDDQRALLALTGGGMDLSREIMTAFMVAGFLPPIHFMPPPRMSDTWTPLHQWLFDGCNRALWVLNLRMGGIASGLDSWRAYTTRPRA